MELGVLAGTPTERVRVLLSVRAALMEEVRKRVVEEVVGPAYDKYCCRATEVRPGAPGVLSSMLFTPGRGGREGWRGLCEWCLCSCRVPRLSVVFSWE